MTTPLFERLITLFDTLIGEQTKKVLKLASAHYPGINAEDIRNPQDFPKLIADAQFNFEDGILAGYLAAKMAVIQELNNRGTEKIIL